MGGCFVQKRITEAQKKNAGHALKDGCFADESKQYTPMTN